MKSTHNRSKPAAQKRSGPGRRGRRRRTLCDAARKLLTIELLAESDFSDTLILSQAAHMDWDWLIWNAQLETGENQVQNYFNKPTIKQPSQTLYTYVYQLMKAVDNYYYSSCEMAFLQNFAEEFSDKFSTLKKSGRLVVIGGGITSPDCLLPMGETFIRNYLLGKQWVDEIGLTWTDCMWLPDDFGLDPQLPVVMEAMGAVAVGFSRIPGSCKAPNKPTVEGYETTSAYELLLPDTGGVTFYWQARDGSEVMAHWLQVQYHQGNTIDNNNANGPGDYTTLEQNRCCDDPADEDYTSSEHIQHYINTNQDVSPTPAVYVHVSNDFTVPKGIDVDTSDASQESGNSGTVDTDTTLQTYVDEWNDDSPDVAATVGTFLDYVNFVQSYEEANPGALRTRDSQSSLPETRFQPNPYWMGYYASCPALKYLHYAGTRAILAAETFQVIAAALGVADSSNDDAIAQAWNDIVPSTHHDYITGTGAKLVYNSEGTDQNGDTVWGEQLQLSLLVYREATAARDNAFQAIVQNVNSSAAGTLVALNSLGTYRTDFVEISEDNGAAYVPEGLDNVQYNSDGSRLLFAYCSSMGFRIESDYRDIPGSVSLSEDEEGNVVLENDYLKATIDALTGTISSLYDVQGDTDVLSGNGNTLKFYNDTGTCYIFGYEDPGAEFSDYGAAPTANPEILLVETGPVRVSIIVVLKYDIDDSTYSYQMEYSLVAGEAFLRMRLKGAAPGSCTVMTEFPLSADIETLQHGTPCHWDSRTVSTYPAVNSDYPFGVEFLATHDFVVAQDADNNYLAGIYHSGGPIDFDGEGEGSSYADNVPASAIAWGAKGGTLMGCVLRSVTDPSGESDNDEYTHSVDYAIRVPKGLSTPEDCQVLKEARRYNTPLLGYVLDKQSGSIDGYFTLVSSGDTNPDVLFTAAKSGAYDADALILRVYKPAIDDYRVLVDVTDYYAAKGSKTLKANAITALEDSSNAEALSMNAGSITYQQESALVTISVTKA